MAQQLEHQGYIVGSAAYFVYLNRNGLLRYVLQQGDIGDEQRLRAVAQAAGRAVRTVLDDLKNRAPMLPFMEARNLARLSTVISQLERLCELAGERLSDAAECRHYLELEHRDARLASRADLRELEAALDILGGGGRYDLPDSREHILEEALRGHFMPEAEVLRFLDDLEGGNGGGQLKDLWRLWQYRKNPGDYGGACREAIGSERYVEDLERSIFGIGFSSRDLSRGAYTYGDSLKHDAQELAKTLAQDIWSPAGDNYVIHENRERILKVVGLLEKWTSYTKGSFEFYLRRLRRLEDFDNAVIEFDTAGAVRARMAWENGKNVMYIEADVRFAFGDEYKKKQNNQNPAGQQNIRLPDSDKKIIIHGFEKWAGAYKVFNDQELEVQVTVQETDSGSYVYVNPNGIYSMAWGGTLPKPSVLLPLVMPAAIPIAAVKFALASADIVETDDFRFLFDWDPDAWKVMFLKSRNLTDDLASHEFGHWLGVQDAYDTQNDDWWLPKPLRYPLNGVIPGTYADYDSDRYTIMDKPNIGHVTNNDIEMVILAFRTGRRQSYQIQFPWEKISEAMGRGN